MKKPLKISVSNLNELSLYAQEPTLISVLASLLAIPIKTYTITITNSQSDPTPQNFQQLLTLDLSNIISSPSQLLNLQFCLDAQCNTPLYAQIWEYNSNLSTVYAWTKLPISIPANGSITIYMFVRNSIQYPYTGINSYYNTAYDNGSYVFDAYINAMGSNYLPSNLQIYSNVYSSIQFTPQSGSTPGYILMLNNQGSSYTVIYLPTTNANNVNEIFESLEYYNGGADNQTLGFLGSGTPSCNITNSRGFDNGYAVGWDPYYSDSQIWSNCNQEVTGSESFTSDGYNFYQAVVTDSEIVYNGATPSSPIVEIPQMTIKEQLSWSSSISPSGSGFLISDGSGGVSHIGYFYWARARKMPPNNVMPSNSQPQLTIVYV